MLLLLQRNNYNLVYAPGSKLILADALSRATQTDRQTDETTAAEFPQQLASLMDEAQLQKLKLVASQHNSQRIDMLHAVAKDDEVYNQLKAQIDAGWPNAALLLTLRPVYSDATQLNSTWS